MSTQVRLEQRSVPASLDGTVYSLEDPEHGNRALVWPALGFNCLSWETNRDGRWLDLLWSDPNIWENPTPTRSGNPILFPFPNRIRDGRFTWDGRQYQLPINDPQQKNAIHGFACRHPWRVLGQGNVLDGKAVAWVRGAFQVSKDAPDCLAYWPTDYEIEVTYALGANELCQTFVIRNPDERPLPCGLGFHPYFRFPADSSSIQVGPAGVGNLEHWVLQDLLPTGERRPLEGKHRLLLEPDIQAGLRQQTFDDAYHVRSTAPMYEARLIDPSRDLTFTMEVHQEFGELVIFIPPHREAICIEPYTCITDAINLEGCGVATGLKVFQPGQEWRASIRWRVGRLRR